MEIISFLILIWLIFIFNFKLELENKWKIILEYHGLLWVFLDYFTIIRYHSNDIPMKWILLKIEPV
jgi:hypothetical protein